MQDIHDFVNGASEMRICSRAVSFEGLVWCQQPQLESSWMDFCQERSVTSVGEHLKGLGIPLADSVWRATRNLYVQEVAVSGMRLW